LTEEKEGEVGLLAQILKVDLWRGSESFPRLLQTGRGKKGGRRMERRRHTLQKLFWTGENDPGISIELEKAYNAGPLDRPHKQRLVSLDSISYRSKKLYRVKEAHFSSQRGGKKRPQIFVYRRTSASKHYSAEKEQTGLRGSTYGA